MPSVSATGSQAYTAQSYLKQQQKAQDQPSAPQAPAQAEALNTSGDRGTVLNVKA